MLINDAYFFSTLYNESLIAIWIQRY